MGSLRQARQQPWASILIVLLMLFRLTHADAAENAENISPEDADDGGAAASNPTASVNFQDLKLRYFELTEGNEEYTFEAEGSYVFLPEFKLTHKIIGARTNRSGDWEANFRELSLKPIYLHPMMPFGVKAKLALGVEWLKDLGKSRDGTGRGSDEIAPLAGIGWLFTDDDFVITLVQYFHSYEEDDGFENVRKTGPRLIYIRKLPWIGGWGKVDLKTSIDHEDDNDFTQTLELQLGTMVSDRIGLFGEVFVGDSVLDTNAFDMGGGLGLRFLY